MYYILHKKEWIFKFFMKRIIYKIHRLNDKIKGWLQKNKIYFETLVIMAGSIRPIKRTRKLFLPIIIFLILFIIIDLYASQNVVSISRYHYNNLEVSSSFTIVQLSDLHDHEFGQGNSRLLEKIRKESPDIIVMTGDMLNDEDTNAGIVLDLIREADQIAPIYYSFGNHELEYMELNDNEEVFRAQLEDAGAVVLEKEYIDTEINGCPVRIGGVYGYVLDREWKDGSEQEFMRDFQDTDRLKILLSHIPEGLLLWKSMEYWDVDLVFSGHVHGGQARLPFIGGVYGPEEGWFPTYTKGMFECGNGTMILSAGLGSSEGLPRINNLPDLVVCTVE